jgi:hypothetical protein
MQGPLYTKINLSKCKGKPQLRKARIFQLWCFYCIDAKRYIKITSVY